MKIFSVRFYKHNKVLTEVVSSKLDKELKRKVKIPKTVKRKIEDIKPEDYDEVKVIVYSVVKQTGLKKKPDMIELGVGGAKDAQLNFVKENLDKEISVLDVLQTMETIDVRGLTKGHGFSGPVKRYGISLKSHKSEKGQRRPGSLGPWHPAFVSFNAKQAGQLGMFSRIVYNKKILGVVKAGEGEGIKDLKKFGNIKTDYIIVKGSVQGPSKRQVLITKALRPNKRSEKAKLELLEIL